jgi:hypothetical protein
MTKPVKFTRSRSASRRASTCRKSYELSILCNVDRALTLRCEKIYSIGEELREISLPHLKCDSYPGCSNKASWRVEALWQAHFDSNCRDNLFCVKIRL